jgi:hypothetical protein
VDDVLGGNAEELNQRNVSMSDARDLKYASVGGVRAACDAVVDHRILQPDWVLDEDLKRRFPSLHSKKEKKAQKNREKKGIPKQGYTWMPKPFKPNKTHKDGAAHLDEIRQNETIHALFHDMDQFVKNTYPFLYLMIMLLVPVENRIFPNMCFTYYGKTGG